MGVIRILSYTIWSLFLASKKEPTPVFFSYTFSSFVVSLQLLSIHAS